MRLLVVEDERDLVSLIRDALEKGGFAADVVMSVAAAQEYLRLVSYDLVVLDSGLPDGDGLDLPRRLRTEETTLPILDPNSTGRSSGSGARSRCGWRRLPGKALPYARAHCPNSRVVAPS